jgi:hypothetical protein
MRSLFVLTLFILLAQPTMAAIIPPMNPFHLQYFAAKKEQHQVVLHWQLTTHHSVHHFVLEHCTQGKVWQPIQEVEVRDGATYYRFTHTDASPGKHLYRLKVVEHSGTALYSSTAQIELSSLSLWRR